MFIIVLLIALTLISYSNSEEDKVEDEVVNAIADTGEARVIVQLKDNVQEGYGILGEEEVNTSEVVNSLNQTEVNVSNEYSIIKGFAGEINAEGLEKNFS